MMERLEHESISIKKVKRMRSAFTTDQVNYLEKLFKKLPYVNSTQRKAVAFRLNISDRAVKIWFQNRRMKEKKELCSKEDFEEQFDHPNDYFITEQMSNAHTLANDILLSSPTLSSSVEWISKSNNINEMDDLKEKCKQNYKDIGARRLKLTEKNSPLFPHYLNSISKNEYLKQNKNNIAKTLVQQNESKTIKMYDDIQLAPMDLSVKNRENNLVAAVKNSVPQICVQLNDGLLQSEIYEPLKLLPFLKPVVATVQNIDNYDNRIEDCNCDCHKKIIPVPVLLQSGLKNPLYVNLR
uniref:Homeobox domain-containing protein n=2 Tax=Bombyx mori TaxID=7091 RepID=A0A8R2HNN7_BOMMO|nr:homeobox protein Hox-A2 [Bombyx mori]